MIWYKIRVSNLRIIRIRIPLIHPYFSGAIGAPHANEFDIVDPYAAYVIPSKIAAMTVINLLYDDAKLAHKIKDSSVPDFADKEEYLAFANSSK